MENLECGETTGGFATGSNLHPQGFLFIPEFQKTPTEGQNLGEED